MGVSRSSSRCETWIMPLLRLADRSHGAAHVHVRLRGLLCGVGWAVMGHADSLPELYTFYALAGFGAALVYCGSMGIGAQMVSR